MQFGWIGSQVVSFVKWMQILEQNYFRRASTNLQNKSWWNEKNERAFIAKTMAEVNDALMTLGTNIAKLCMDNFCSFRQHLVAYTWAFNWYKQFCLLYYVPFVGFK